MVESFINRRNELSLLQEELKKRKASLIVVYGRRRVGKTELVKKIIKKGSLYLYIPNQSRESLMGFLAEELYQQNNDPLLKDFRFKNINQFFEYLIEKKYTEIIFDEFHRLEKEKGALSVLQHYWDNYFSKNDTKIILVGSSISMTKKLVLSYNGPLFGRRTLELFIKPFKLKELMEWFKGYDIEKIMEIYSIFGGTPAYLLEYDSSLGLFGNVERNILRKGKLLFNEVEHLLNIETRQPGTYLNIIKQLSLGNTKLNEIYNKTGIKRTKLSFYLDVLRNDLNIIRKICPVTEDETKSKKGIYVLDDPYFIFWLKFVYKNISELERGNIGTVTTQIKKEFNKHISFIFENACRHASKKMLNYDKTGSWWGHYRDKEGTRKEIEIDIVAINEQKKEILFAECKWQDNVNAEKILCELKEKAKFVNWHNKERKEYYAVFAKSFKIFSKGKNFLLFDLKDITFW